MDTRNCTVENGKQGLRVMELVFPFLLSVDGKGVLSQHDVKYQGFWKNGMKVKVSHTLSSSPLTFTKGLLTWSNGDTYTGKFKHDKIHGKGTLKCANGDKYEGKWRHGKVS